VQSGNGQHVPEAGSIESVPQVRRNSGAIPHKQSLQNTGTQFGLGVPVNPKAQVLSQAMDSHPGTLPHGGSRDTNFAPPDVSR